MNVKEMFDPNYKCTCVLCCFYNLKPIHISVYRDIVKYGEKNAQEIGEFLGKDRSTAYRVLTKLCSLDILYKKTQYLTRGGYYHIYAARDPMELMRDLRTNITDWYDRMMSLIEEAEKKTGTLQGLTHHFNKRAIFSETVREMIREENIEAIKKEQSGVETV